MKLTLYKKEMEKVYKRKEDLRLFRIFPTKRFFRAVHE